MSHDSDRGNQEGRGQGRADRDVTKRDPSQPVIDAAKNSSAKLYFRGLAQDRGPAPDGSTAVSSTELTLSASYHEGQIPSADELAAYAGIAPDLVDRIVRMAEENQAAIIRDSRDARESQRASQRVEGWALKVAVFAASFLPWLATVAAVLLALLDSVTPAVISAVIGVTSAAPQIIDATRRAIRGNAE